MLDIITVIPGKKRSTPSGWHTFNGVCCHNRGHRQDNRSRAGIIFTSEDQWNYHCFNCQFKCGYQLGKLFSKNLRLLLTWCGVDQDQITKLSFESFSKRAISDIYNSQDPAKVINFKEVPLPVDSRPVDIEKDAEHVAYLHNRGISTEDYPFYVVDNEVRNRIIIPYFHNGKIVGNTSRFYDNRQPKYLSEQQKGYVFNLANQRANWKTCILVEGQFDAISIGGCAYMGSTISDMQADLIRQLQREIIVVPDRDAAGLSICDRALELGYKISIPNWGDEIKDVNDAVCKYGKLPTLLSILQNATSSKIVLEIKRKRFK